MKRNKGLFVVALIAAGAFTSAPLFAMTKAQLAHVREAVAKVPVVEMGAKAAKLVKATAKADREAVALEAVRGAIAKSPETAAPVVGAVVGVVPQYATTIAALAADLVPTQAEAIAKAAAASAPKEAALIAKRLAKLFPKKSEHIAAAVVAAVPSSANQVSTVRFVRVSAANPVTGGNVITTGTQIGGASFPQAPPIDVSDYAAPGGVR